MTRRGPKREARAIAAVDTWKHRCIPSALFLAGIVRRLYVPRGARAAVAVDRHDGRWRLYVVPPSTGYPVR